MKLFKYLNNWYSQALLVAVAFGQWYVLYENSHKFVEVLNV